jgi:hypothetical protein
MNQVAGGRINSVGLKSNEEEKMKRIASLLLIAILLAIPQTAAAQENGWQIKPLPVELSHYYQQQRARGFDHPLRHFILGTPEKCFYYYEKTIRHDIGAENTPTSNMARDYLMENVILPLKERKSVTLQNGSIIGFEELDRLALAQLIYYFSRDHILFFGEELEGGEELPPIGDKGDILTSMRQILPRISIRFPCEMLAMRHAFCDKAVLLATLLKLAGYEVALGFFPSTSVPIPPQAPKSLLYWPGAYHNYVFLKDEGWGIGHWKLDQDTLGNRMGGDWILLDCIHSPRHFPQETLAFGEDPTSWTRFVQDELRFIPLVRYPMEHPPFSYFLLQMGSEFEADAPWLIE